MTRSVPNAFLLLSFVYFSSATTTYYYKGPPDSCPEIVTKDDWGGRDAVAVDYVIMPVKNVIIHHTVTPKCNNLRQCSSRLQSIQDFHIDEMDFQDIGYNFLVGSDGKVYEGAGWRRVGAHTRRWNSKSIGIGFIGDFSHEKPNARQLEAAKKLIRCAVDKGELSADYNLFGARDVRDTNSPGNQLYREIQKWPHYTSSP